MLATMIRFSLTQRLMMLLAVVLLAGTGWYAFQKTPIDAFPDVSTTQVKVIIKTPGMTPEEVEERITALIEVEMLGIPRMTMLRSVAKYALTDITVDFEEGTDIYWARQQVSDILEEEGIEVVEAFDGLEALQMRRSGRNAFLKAGGDILGDNRVIHQFSSLVD